MDVKGKAKELVVNAKDAAVLATKNKANSTWVEFKEHCKAELWAIITHEEPTREGTNGNTNIAKQPGRRPPV